jgi:hypothetical protein
MTVVSALKQSLQQSGGPGSSVNTHPNPFFLNVTGEINLKHMAELVIERIESYEADLKAKIEKAIHEAEAKAKLAEEQAKAIFGADAKAKLAEEQAKAAS